MKKLVYPTLLIVLILAAQGAFSQQNLGDKILRKAKDRANRKIDRTIDKGLDEVEKEVDDAAKGGGNEKEQEKGKGSSSSSTKTGGSSSTAGSGTSGSGSSGKSSSTTKDKSFEAYSKFNFVPGDRLLFTDDFSVDQLGDFPSKWTTDGSGTVASTDDGSRWFELVTGSTYIPVLDKNLPEEYTIEFDLRTTGLTDKISSTSYLQILLDDNNLFKPGSNLAQAEISLCQYINSGIEVRNKVSGTQVIKNRIEKEIRARVKNGTHVSIAVNKKRMRLWLDEDKIIDVPTFVPTGVKQLKLFLKLIQSKTDDAHVYLGNVKVAEGGVDLRSKLITEGRLSTTAITFAVNSDVIRPQSAGMLKEIADVLSANPDVRIQIVGHTDSDGDAAYNMDLSKKRAIAVKNILSSEYGVAANRIETEGKGETKPEVPNDTPEGKAANRRVEFIKL